MPLLEDLRSTYHTIDPQFLPTSQEIPGVLGALALYVEHGDGFLEAARQSSQHVTELITSAAAGAAESEATAEERDQQAAESSRRATAQQTKLTEHEPAAPARGKGKG